MCLPGLPLTFASCVQTKHFCCCSPPRSAVLEAVVDPSPEQSWSMASGLSRTARASESPSSSALSQNREAPAEAPGPAMASQAASPSELQTDGQNNNEHIPLPSLSGSDLSSSLIGADTHISPSPVQADLRDDDSFDSDDSMSEQSSGTAVMVGHPCSDEEDTAERRWRLAEQRGNDIRRASAPPCPKAVGTKGYLKVIVVRRCLPVIPSHTAVHCGNRRGCFGHTIVLVCSLKNSMPFNIVSPVQTTVLVFFVIQKKEHIAQL